MGCWNKDLHVVWGLPEHTVLLVLLKSRVQSVFGISALIQSKTKIPVLQEPPGLKGIGLKILLQRHKYSFCQQ